MPNSFDDLAATIKAIEAEKQRRRVDDTSRMAAADVGQDAAFADFTAQLITHAEQSNARLGAGSRFDVSAARSNPGQVIYGDAFCWYEWAQRALRYKQISHDDRLWFPAGLYLDVGIGRGQSATMLWLRPNPAPPGPSWAMTADESTVERPGVSHRHLHQFPDTAALVRHCLETLVRTAS